MAPSLRNDLADCSKAEKPNECAYFVGKTYYEAGRFDLAGPVFVRIALDPSAGPSGPYAAHLAIDSLHVLAARAAPPRPVCFAEMQALVPKLRTRYCDANGAAHDEELCSMLIRIAVASTRRQADALFSRAKQEPESSAALYRRAAETYRALFDEHCRLDAAGKNARGEAPAAELQCEELIYNTYVICRASGDDVGAEAAKAALLDPRNGLTDSELTRDLADK